MDLEVEDVADLLGMQQQAVENWVEEGKIPAYKMGNEYRFSRIEIENWMMQRKQDDLGKTQTGWQQFALYRALHKGSVYRGIVGKDKETVIRNTMKKVADSLKIDAEGVSDLLLDRESLMSTALGRGIAVPHTRDFLLEKGYDVVVTVFPDEPLEYDALDHQPITTLFFLFASSDKRHLHLLAKLAHLCAHQPALEFLKLKPNQEQLLDFIRSWEANLRFSS